MAGYGDDAGFAAWLLNNGITVPTGAPDTAVLRQRGSDWLDIMYGSRFVGSPAGGISQERAWPRVGAVVFGETVDPSVVPDAVIKASYRAAFDAASDAGLTATVNDPARIKRDKVGDTETEYFELGSGDNGAIASVFDGLLAPYLRLGGLSAIDIRSVG